MHRCSGKIKKILGAVRQYEALQLWFAVLIAVNTGQTLGMTDVPSPVCP